MVALAASVATLVAAVVTMAPLVAQRLESERLADLRGLARTVRPELSDLPDRDLHPHSRALLRIADRLERRAGGRIVILDNSGRVLADTAPVGGHSILPDLERERARAIRHPDMVVSGTHGGRAFAVTLSDEDRRGRVTLVISKPLDDTRAAATVVRHVLPLGLAAGLVVGTVLTFLLGRSVVRRLAHLHDDARALSDEGLQHPVAVEGHDEVTVVARALEDMRARLVEQEASRQAFVATASHELRTPLASLQATLELLREEVLDGRIDPALAAARADTALRQTHRLVALAGDLLDITRVDGEASLHPEPLELGELVGTIAPEFAPRLEGAGRTLSVEGGPALVVADPAATARVLRILLENAYNYAEGPVHVTIRARGDRTVLAVADEGPGLAPAEREQVFVRFARGSAAQGKPGSGLGLAIARGLARAQGGELAVANGDGAAAEGSASGATFELSLPAWHGEP
jgi:signal transduction histidine kinase